MAGADAAAECLLDRFVGVDRDDRRDRRHHFAGLLLVQVEDAAEHPGLPGIERAAAGRRLDDLAQVGAGVLLVQVPRVDAEEPNDRVRCVVEQVGERRAQGAEYVERPREQACGCLSLRDREHLRDLLADGDMERRRDRERDRDRDPVRAGPVAEQRLEQVGDRRLAEEADAQRGECDPELARGERLVDLVELLEDLLGTRLTLLGERLDPARATAHERELGRDEEPVEDHEQNQEEEEERRHRVRGARESRSAGRTADSGQVLRGRSSSIRDGRTVAARGGAAWGLSPSLPA